MKNPLILVTAFVCSTASAQSYAFSLNGTNSFLEIADNNAIDFSNSFTMEPGFTRLETDRNRSRVE